MQKVRFSMVIDGIERVNVIEIDESELCPKIIQTLPPDYQTMYRHNVIEKHMQKWALSKLKLSYRERINDESDAGNPHPRIKRQKAKKAKQG